eukprot:869141-Rhodomonas_salina.1
MSTTLLADSEILARHFRKTTAPPDPTAQSDLESHAGACSQALLSGCRGGSTVTMIMIGRSLKHQVQPEGRPRVTGGRNSEALRRHRVVPRDSTGSGCDSAQGHGHGHGRVLLRVRA